MSFGPRRAQLDTGLSYSFLEWPSQSTHTLVLIHGFLDFGGGFRPMVSSATAGTSTLQERFHVVAPDMRGHGESDRIGAGGYYHFLDYVADLRSFISEVGRDEVSLVGHSMGGSIAGYYAGCYPTELQKLVLMEGMGPPDDHTPAPDRVTQWVRGWKRASLRTPHTYASIEEAGKRLQQHDALLAEDLALKLAEWGTREDETGKRVFKHDPLHLSMGPIGYSVDVAKTFWERIQCPVLLVDGAESKLNHTKEERNRRAACLPNAQQVSIEGAGHMMQRHKPQQLAEILLKFLG